ncbi:MAG: YcaO-like family protein [Psittacicella sp.]
MKTFIPGKDLSLEDSLNNFQTLLAKIGIDIEIASELNEVSFIWSTHIKDKNCNLCFSNGKGASQKASLASAYGEFFERLSTQYYFADFFLKKDKISQFYNHPKEIILDPNKVNIFQSILNQDLLKFYDENNELSAESFIDFSSKYNLNNKILAIPYYNTTTKENVYFPQYLINSIYASNGMSAGNNKYEARVQALSEILERAAKKDIISKAITMPKIPEEILNSFDKIQTSIKEIKSNGYSIKVLDASYTYNFPIICILLLNPTNNTVFASFGAHPLLEVAIERTLTELLQGRSLQNLDVFTTPVFDLDLVSDNLNIENHFIDSNGLVHWNILKDTPDYKFNNWNILGNTEEQYNSILKILKSKKLDIYIAEYTHLGVYTCRILVPGLSEIYPVNDLVENYTEERFYFNKKFLKLFEKSWEKAWYLEFLEELEDSLVSDSMMLGNYLGLPIENSSYWKDMKIIEFKLILAICSERLELAQEFISLLLDIGATSTKRELSHYKLLQASIDLFINNPKNKDNFKDGFINLFNENDVNYIWNLLDNKSNIFEILFNKNQTLEKPRYIAELNKIYTITQQLY